MSTPPRVGQIVHYVAHGTPIRADGTQAYPPACRAAIVTQVHDWTAPAGQSDHAVGLSVLNPTGMFFNVRVPGDPGDPAESPHPVATVRTPGARCHTGDRAYPGGTWHYPEPDGDDDQ